jgi:hypothetical protein
VETLHSLSQQGRARWWQCTASKLEVALSMKDTRAGIGQDHSARCWEVHGTEKKKKKEKEKKISGLERAVLRVPAGADGNELQREVTKNVLKREIIEGKRVGAAGAPARAAVEWSTPPPPEQR